MNKGNTSAQTADRQSEGKNKGIPKAPEGGERFKWLGPAFLWMLSAAGSGELLFTPRVASLYGYTLLWAMLAAVTLKWFINREVGRFSVCTGATILEGFKTLPGPKNWAVWIILLPQAVVAVASIAGLASAAATALIVITGGTVQMWMAIIATVTASIILLGQYSAIDKVASFLAVVLSIAVLAAAISVFPKGGELASGLVPQLPSDVQYQEILPWLGFMLAGAAGLMWYSYWVSARGYGAASLKPEQPINPQECSEEERNHLKGWLHLMTLSNTLAVAGALIIAFAFMILGGELLRPEGLVPEENRIAETLAHLLGGVWGQFGFWFMILATFVTFCSTTLSDQDGWGRMFPNGTGIILRGFGVSGRWTNRKFLQRFYIIVLLVILPIAVYFFFGKPVGLLQTAGAIEAGHIPIVTGLTLYLNHRMLPKELQPSAISFWVTVLAGLFFAGFALFYLLQLTGVMGSGG